MGEQAVSLSRLRRRAVDSLAARISGNHREAAAGHSAQEAPGSGCPLQRAKPNRRISGPHAVSPHAVSPHATSSHAAKPMAQQRRSSAACKPACSTIRTALDARAQCHETAEFAVNGLHAARAACLAAISCVPATWFGLRSSSGRWTIAVGDCGAWGIGADRCGGGWLLHLGRPEEQHDGAGARWNPTIPARHPAAQGVDICGVRAVARRTPSGRCAGTIRARLHGRRPVPKRELDAGRGPGATSYVC